MLWLVLLAGLVIIFSIWAFFALSRASKPLRHRLPDFHHEFAGEISPPPLPPLPPPVPWEPELPAGYGDTRIVALPRDPYWLYAYWEISSATRSTLERQYGQSFFQRSRPVIKVRGQETDSRIVDIFDLEINDYADNWYIKVPFPDRTYILDLGRVLPDGTFVLIARSNPVTTPRATFSDRTDPEWATIGALYERTGLFGPSSPGAGAGLGGISSEELMRRNFAPSKH